MSTAIEMLLADLKARQLAGEHLPCPSCGRDTMKERVATNALSRHAEIYVCDACGMAEALLCALGAPIQLDQWACAKPDE